MSDRDEYLDDAHKPQNSEQQTTGRQPKARDLDPEVSPYNAQRIIPHGDVSLDGRAAYPSPSLSSKIIVWGGLAVGVAGLTAASVMAARGVAHLIAGDDDDKDDARPMRRTARRRPGQPMRPRARVTAMEGSRGFAEFQHQVDEMTGAEGPPRPQRPRRPARRRPQPRQAGMMENVSDGFGRLASTISGAIAGLQYVAREAGGLISSFADTADNLRGVFRRDGSRSGENADDPRASAGSAQKDPDALRRHRL
ncbi:hypothetical protein [Paracoccus pacificus]|uniref:Uncharacterized protein n=1 Tax=Paracoccus pacificus TaxID=1463598 RepID=A0ABW4R912_9RHOB